MTQDKKSAVWVNTPALETERLILRRFTKEDAEAVFLIYSDKEVNTYLPCFPLKTMEEAEAFLEERYLRIYEEPQGYRYAVCLKEDPAPIGYINVSMDESHDFGYGLRKEFWHRGIVTEGCRAVIGQLKKDGLPYITATHDINNPRSGQVMKRLGMEYQYTYKEQWQPKDILVRFRMYQMNLDGNRERVYRGYWDRYPEHEVEKGGV